MKTIEEIYARAKLDAEDRGVVVSQLLVKIMTFKDSRECPLLMEDYNFAAELHEKALRFMKIIEDHLL